MDEENDKLRPGYFIFESPHLPDDKVNIIATINRSMFKPGSANKLSLTSSIWHEIAAQSEGTGVKEISKDADDQERKFKGSYRDLTYFITKLARGGFFVSDADWQGTIQDLSIRAEKMSRDPESLSRHSQEVQPRVQSRP